MSADNLNAAFMLGDPENCANTGCVGPYPPFLVLHRCGGCPSRWHTACLAPGKRAGAGTPGWTCPGCDLRAARAAAGLDRDGLPTCDFCGCVAGEAPDYSLTVVPCLEAPDGDEGGGRRFGVRKDPPLPPWGAIQIHLNCWRSNNNRPEDVGSINDAKHVKDEFCRLYNTQCAYCQKRLAATGCCFRDEDGHCPFNAHVVCMVRYEQDVPAEQRSFIQWGQERWAARAGGAGRAPAVGWAGRGAAARKGLEV